MSPLAPRLTSENRSPEICKEATCEPTDSHKRPIAGMTTRWTAFQQTACDGREAFGDSIVLVNVRDYDPRIHERVPDEPAKKK
jgi:hypothetical protein